MRGFIAFCVLFFFAVTAHAAPAVNPPAKAGCKCDSDPRGCLCHPTGAHQKHNYPCGDEACPWAHLSSVKTAAPCRSCEAAGYGADGRRIVRQAPAPQPAVCAGNSCGSANCGRRVWFPRLRAWFGG
jgi:hypothetical protein